jgi:polygalacturonase
LVDRLHACFDQGHRQLFFPDGLYELEATLRLPSGTHLKLAAGATLRLATGAMQTCDDYLLCNADPVGGNQDITIEGGTIDGNQIGNPRPEGLFTEGYTGAMLHFENVRGLTLRELTLQNAEAYYSRYTSVHDFLIEDIRFDSDCIRHNNDGIHLGGNCSNGIIRRIRAERPGVTGDDLVALNADDAQQRNEVRGMQCGPIENIQIESLFAHSCHSFVRLLSVVSPIRNITITHLRGACSHCAINADGARICKVPVFDTANPPTPDGVGLLADITISDVAVSKVASNGMALIDLQERMQNLRIHDFQRVPKPGVAEDSPTLRIRFVRPKTIHINGEETMQEQSTDIDQVWEHRTDRITDAAFETEVSP